MSHQLIIKEATASNREGWNGFVDHFYGRGFCYYEWKAILKMSYNVEGILLVAQKFSGEIAGVLPTYICRDCKGNKNLYTPRHGLLVENDNVAIKILEHVKGIVQKNKIISTSISTGAVDVARYYVNKKKISIVLPIKGSEEETWKSLRRDTRQGINRSLRRGATTEWGFHNLKDFYDIYENNLLSKGVPIHGYQFFLAIAEYLKSTSDLIVVRSKGKVIAGMIVLWSRHTLDLYIGGWLSQYAKVIPYQLMFWETIKEAQRRNLRLVDMGESTEDSGTYKFKMNFGGLPQEIYYLSPEKSRGSSDIYERHPVKKGHFSSTKSNVKRLLHNVANSFVNVSPYLLKKKIALYRKTKSRIL